MTYQIHLTDVNKGYTADLDKAVRPEETVRRFKEKLSRVDLDIFEQTIRIDNGRLDIPVYFSICGKDAERLIGTKKQMGKGGTPHQAEASAVMELAERFSFYDFYNNSDNFISDTYRNLKKTAIPFESIAQSVHDETEDLEKAHAVFSDLPLKWTWAYDLTHQKEVQIPFDWFFAINQFNGTSAGNCVEEAVSQGICEVVERHVSSIISREKGSTTAVDLDSARDPMVLEMAKKYRNAGIKLFVTDFSLNTGIPTVGVLAYDPATFPKKSEIVWTAGTTPGPQKALCRALSEVTQLAGDFNTGSNYVASGLPKFRTVEEAEFITQAENRISILDLPDISDSNLKVEVENSVKALSGNQMDVLLVDVTHASLQIPAFYTIIPGAHFRERATGTSVGMFSAKLIAEGGNPVRALKELEKMDRLLPEKYYIKFFLGAAHLELSDCKKALTCFSEALKMDPQKQDIPSIYTYMGIALKDMERYEEAIDQLNVAETFDNERTDIYNLMGFCFFKLKAHDKAIAAFRKVLKLNPASAIDYANIASNYRDMGEHKKAAQYYQFALELDPTIEFAAENLKKLSP